MHVIVTTIFHVKYCSYVGLFSKVPAYWQYMSTLIICKTTCSTVSSELLSINIQRAIRNKLTAHIYWNFVLNWENCLCYVQHSYYAGRLLCYATNIFENFHNKFRIIIATERYMWSNILYLNFRIILISSIVIRHRNECSKLYMCKCLDMVRTCPFHVEPRKLNVH